MRSVVVVFPASMWAMMPMFLHRSNGTVLDTTLFLSSLRDSCSPTMFTGLPKIHLIRVLCDLCVTFANFAVKGSSKLTTEIAKKNRKVRAANAASLHFKQRLDVFHRLFEQLQRLISALLL